MAQGLALGYRRGTFTVTISLFRLQKTQNTPSLRRPGPRRALRMEIHGHSHSTVTVSLFRLPTKVHDFEIICVSRSAQGPKTFFFILNGTAACPGPRGAFDYGHRSTHQLRKRGHMVMDTPWPLKVCLSYKLEIGSDRPPPGSENHDNRT